MINCSLKTVFIFLSFALAACGGRSSGEGQRSEAKQTSTGLPSEVLLAADNEVLGSVAIDSLEALLECPMPGLNQMESFFRVSRINLLHDKYETKRMHSRLLVRIKHDAKEVSLGVARNVTARPQLQLQLTAPSVEELLAYLPQHAEGIRRMLLDNQLCHLTMQLHRHASAQVIQDLAATLGYTIDAPEEIRFTKRGKDFLWASSRSNERQLNLVFYTRPYYGPHIEDARALALLRDSVMMENIPGNAPDQWMETVWEQDMPVVSATTRLQEVYVNGRALKSGCSRLVTEMRGLWQMRHGAMGGPFVSISFIDSVAHRLVVAEGFVFSPSTSKRDLIRRLESSLRTFRRTKTDK